MRGFRPEQPDLISRRVQDARVRLYATPDYLAGLERVDGQPDLHAAEYIGFDDTERLIDLLNQHGLSVNHRNFPLLTLNQLVQWEWVKRGLGIGLMLEAVGDREPLVQRVLPDPDPILFPSWLVAHRGLRTSRRVRLVFDLLVAELG